MELLLLVGFPIPIPSYCFAGATIVRTILDILPHPRQKLELAPGGKSGSLRGSRSIQCVRVVPCTPAQSTKSRTDNFVRSFRCQEEETPILAAKSVGAGGSTGGVVGRR